MKYTIDEFAEQIKSELEQIFEFDKIRIVKFDKTNAHKVAVVREFVKTDAGNLGQTSYVDGFFEEGRDYSNNDIKKIVLKISTNMMFNENNAEVQMIKDMNILDYEWVKDKIYYTLVNEELNKKMLSNVPHRKFLDMVVIYKVCIGKTAEGNLLVDISTPLLEKWGVDEKTLYQLAVNNTPRLFPHSLQNVFEEIKGFCSNIKEGEFMKDEKLFVLSNELIQCGAAVVMYDGVLKQVAKQLDVKKFVFVMSSLHEAIIFIRNSFDEKELFMLKAMNLPTCGVDNFLSDSVYEYDREMDEIKILV